MKINRLILLIIGVLCLLHTPIYSNTTLPDVTYSEHPRILLDEEIEKQIAANISQDPIWSILQKNTIEACDVIISLEPLERIVEGRRMLGTSREALYRLFMLSYSYQTTKDMKYAVRAKEELLNVCSYKDWNPSHFLDVAEMSMAVSIAYDWLYNVLDKKTRDFVRKALVDKGLKPSLDKKYNYFLQKHTNWNQVCNTAMAYAAIAIIEDEPKLAEKIITRSLESVQKPMLRYESEGAYPEGYGYWHYGTTYNVMLIALMEHVYGTDFGMADKAGFMRSPYYVRHMVGATRLPFNFGDSDSELRLNTSMFWFAQKLNDPSLVKNEIETLLAAENFYEQYRRMLPSVFVLGSGMKLSETPEMDLPLMFVARNQAPVSLMRTAWDDKDAIFVGIKGGTASDNTHTHLDAGNFIMDALGVRWAIDLGSQSYHDLEVRGLSIWNNSPGSDRWKVHRYTNFSHNVVTINDKLFKSEGDGVIESFSEDPMNQTVTLDLSSLYDDISTMKRTASIVNKKVVSINDSICTSSNPAQVTWRMLTQANATIIGNVIELRQDGKCLFISVPDGTVPFVEHLTPKADYDQKTPGVYVVGYKTTLAANTKQNLQVRMIPHSSEQVKEICDRVADWQIEHYSEVPHHDLDWTNGALYKGLVEWAKLTNNEKYFSFLNNQGEKNDWDVYYRQHHADDICVSQMYIDLARKDNNPLILSRTIERLDSVIMFPSSAPLLKSDPKGKDERWSWSDALFMAPPVYAGIYEITGDKKYLDFMNKEFIECTDSLYNYQANLYYRDGTKKVLREPNGAEQYWARGNGWVFAALPLLIDILPEDEPSRQYFIDLFKMMAKGVLATQDDQGSWHASLLDPESYPLPENSASAFFCYGFAWGIRNGLLDKQTYYEPTLRAWSTLTGYVHDDGKLGYIQPVGNAPRHADEHSTDVYGVGAFLLAGSEMVRLN